MNKLYNTISLGCGESFWDSSILHTTGVQKNNLLTKRTKDLLKVMTGTQTRKLTVKFVNVSPQDENGKWININLYNASNPYSYI